uniref:Uncharacterized protein n=1 Tax=Cyprinus carpio TaxID=7962 RepID=A0A8C1KYG1_CYPCA
SDSVELSEQIKAATKDSHVRAENTELMLSYQRGRLLLCSLYKIYEALEEALDTNASHEAVAPIYFPQELSRLESIGKDLEYFYGRSWREKMTVPAATLRYAQRLREVNINNHASPVVSHIKIQTHICLELFKRCLICADFSPDSHQNTFSLEEVLLWIIES